MTRAQQPKDTVSGQRPIHSTNACESFLLVGSEELVGKSKIRYLKLSLESSQGIIKGFVWPEFRPYVACPALHTPVRVRAKKQTFNGELQLRVEALRPVLPNELSSATALLCPERCPDFARPSLQRLAELEAALPPPLDGFLRQILLDPRILPTFLTCRASARHHHAYPGGLLVHSTSMLSLAGELARHIVPNDPWTPHLAQLGYLLHDLGKIRSVGEVRRPEHPFAMAHEHVTIELLSPHLAWLDEQSFELATAIRSILSYIALPSPSRKQAPLAAAEVVAMLDQLSASTFRAIGLPEFLEDASSKRDRSGRVYSFPSGSYPVHT